MFENKLIEWNGDKIHATRFIASWCRSGGQLVSGKDHDDFETWLISLDISMDDIEEILYLARTGKLELETKAKRFLNSI